MTEETVNGKIRSLLKSMSDAMMEAVEKIARSDIKALTIKLWNGATYKMTEKDGHVVTERSETLTDSVTA